MTSRANSWPKRPLIVAGGFALTFVGAVLLLLPGPGLILLALGLSMLSAEYLWARNALRRVRDFLRRRGL